MRVEQRSWTSAYRLFDVGERVQPVSDAVPLPPGVYTVRTCYPPQCACEPAIVHLEGHPYGVSGQYLQPVEGEEDGR